MTIMRHRNEIIELKVHLQTQLLLLFWEIGQRLIGIKPNVTGFFILFRGFIYKSLQFLPLFLFKILNLVTLTFAS